MTKQTMKDRIDDAVAGGDEKAIRQRVQICMDGLRTVRTGHTWANELIDELGLEKYGAKKIEPPDESERRRRKKIVK
jgi:hypothetical protein